MAHRDPRLTLTGSLLFIAGLVVGICLATFNPATAQRIDEPRAFGMIVPGATYTFTWPDADRRWETWTVKSVLADGWIEVEIQPDSRVMPFAPPATRFLNTAVMMSIQAEKPRR